MFIGIKLQYNFNIITILTYCSCQFCATFMFAFSTGTSERRCVGFSCGRAGYVAGIWFGSLFKVISFELFAFVSFQYFSFGFGRTFLCVESFFRIGMCLAYFYLYGMLWPGGRSVVARWGDRCIGQECCGQRTHLAGMENRNTKQEIGKCRNVLISHINVI